MSNESFKVDNSSIQVIELKDSSHSLRGELAVEAEADINKSLENTDDRLEGSGSTEDISNESLFGEGSLQQTNLQNCAATGGTNAKDSQESLFSNGCTKFQRISQLGGVILTSQPGGATVGIEYLPSGETIVTEFQPGCSASGTESQAGGVTSDTESQAGGVTSGTESQTGGGTVCTEYKPGCRSSTNSEFSNAANSLSRQTSQDSSSSDYGSIHSRETAVVGDSISQTSLERDSVVDDSIRQAALENDAAEDVSNSSNTQEELVNGIESWEGMAAPIQVPQLRFRDEREDEPIDMTRVYVEGFRHCGFICDYLMPCSMLLQKYRFFTFFFRSSIAITASLAFGFGADNVSDCPVNTQLPILLMLLGVDLAVILSTIWEPGRFSIVVKAIAHSVFFMLFINILRATYTISPSFDPTNLREYCKMELYYFAYYMTFVIPAIVIFAFFLYIPTEIFFNRLFQNTRYLQL